MELKAGKIFNEDDTEDAVFSYEEDQTVDICNTNGDLFLRIDPNDFIAIAEAIKAERREDLITKFLIKQLKK